MSQIHYPRRVEKIISFVINLLCHTFILLLFLISFFFIYVAKLTSQEVDNEIQSLITDQTNQILISLDQKDTRKLINWERLGQLASQMEGQYYDNVQSVIDNNRNLQENCTCFLFLFGMSIFLLVCYLMLRGVNLGLKFIVIENFVIFAFVGMIEIYFFLNIASKYIPVLPNDALTTTLSRLKDRLTSGG